MAVMPFQLNAATMQQPLHRFMFTMNKHQQVVGGSMGYWPIVPMNYQRQACLPTFYRAFSTGTFELKIHKNVETNTCLGSL